MQLQDVIYTDDLTLLEREQVLYRAFIFNRTLKKMWNSLFNQVLKISEENIAYLDYFLLESLIQVGDQEDQPLLNNLYNWLLEGGECPVFISEDLSNEAKLYALNCIRDSLKLNLDAV